MSKVSSILNPGKAAKKAASAQSAAADRAIEEQTKARLQAREDLEPFREVGSTDLEGLGKLVTDPQSQLDFIQNNPFFEALAKKSSDTLLGNQAAKGKVGSGGTAEELQNSLLLLGTDLVNQNINQRQNLATLGSNAASQQASTTLNTSTNIGDLLTQQGNAKASGIIGANNANIGVATGIAKTIALCDARAKENIKHVGHMANGLPLYSFNYTGDDEPQINVMAQDVEKVMPDAVIEIDGLKHVNMEMITCH